MGSEETTLPVYVLDTSFLTQPKRDYYPFDIWPVFWSTLSRLAADGRIETIDKVQDEITRWTGKDELKTWIKSQPPAFCYSTDNEDVIKAYAEITKWVNSQKFTPAAVLEFAGAADGWVVAHALVNKRNVASQETHKPEARAKVSIVNICLAFGVKHDGVNEVLRTFGVCFK